MSSYRLYREQIARIRATGAPLGAVVRSAVARFQRGEISVTPNTANGAKSQKVLQVFSIRNRFAGIDDAKLRAILDAHFACPVNFDREIAALDREIAAYESELRRVVALDADGQALGVRP